MEPITFTVPAIPVAQPRPRATLAHGGKGARMHEVTSIKGGDGERRPHPIAAYKATVRLAMLDAYDGPPLECPLVVSLTCVFPSQKKARKWKATKPDCDNLAKSTLDALNGLLFKDDSQVVELHVVKFHAAGDEQPHVEIFIAQAEPLPIHKDAPLLAAEA
jgi:Holliday junction resolvase RusA-like endonuclease